MISSRQQFSIKCDNEIKKKYKEPRGRVSHSSEINYWFGRCSFNVYIKFESNDKSYLKNYDSEEA